MKLTQTVKGSSLLLLMSTLKGIAAKKKKKTSFTIKDMKYVTSISDHTLSKKKSHDRGSDHVITCWCIFPENLALFYE